MASVGGSILVYFETDEDASEEIARLEMLLSRVGLSFFLIHWVEPFIQERTRKRFDSEGDDASGPWMQLKETTQALRQRGGFGGSHPINVRTGEMWEWATQSRASIGTAGDYTEMRYPEREPTGYLRQKVQTAQRGRAHPATVPRPILAIGTTDAVVVLAQLSRFLVEDVAHPVAGSL